MPDATVPTPLIPIAEALRQLPLDTPDRSAWPALAARLSARRKPLRQWPWAITAAAALAVVAVLPQRDLPTPAPSPTPVVSSDAQTLMALMDESAQLEQLLAALADSDMASASATELSLDIEDQLSQIDARLANADPAGDERLTLWQQRVSLLRDYAGLESTRRWLASQGERLDGSLVSVF